MRMCDNCRSPVGAEQEAQLQCIASRWAGDNPASLFAMHQSCCALSSMLCSRTICRRQCALLHQKHKRSFQQQACEDCADALPHTSDSSRCKARQLLTSGKSYEGIDGLLEAAISLARRCGLQGHKVGEVRTLPVLHRPPQPLHDLGHAGLLGLVKRRAVQNPHLPEAHAQLLKQGCIITNVITPSALAGLYSDGRLCMWQCKNYMSLYAMLTSRQTHALHVSQLSCALPACTSEWPSSGCVNCMLDACWLLQLTSPDRGVLSQWERCSRTCEATC